MKIRLLLLIFLPLLLIGFGCKQKFNRTGWDNGDGLYYPERDAMLDNLLKEHPLKGLKYQEMVALLGKPRENDSVSVYYNVKVKFDPVNPIYAKDLVCYFNKDSVITRITIKEWKK
jgi:hypothetical protein